MPKRTGESFYPTLKVGWRQRPLITYDHSRAGIALNRVSDEAAYSYYKASGRKETRISSDILDMREETALYADKFGTKEQAAYIRSMNPRRLKWLYENGLFVYEEYFVYSADMFGETTDAPIAGKQAARIQRFIDLYNNLYAQGRAERNRRRRSRDWA